MCSVAIVFAAVKFSSFSSITKYTEQVVPYHDNKYESLIHDNVYRPTLLASKQDFRVMMRLHINDDRA